MLLSTFIEFKNHFGPLIVIYWIWKSLRTITKLVMNTHTCENVHRTVYWHHVNSIEMCIQCFKKILSFILSCVLSFVLNTHLSIFITVSGDQLRWFRNGSSRSTTRRNRRFLLMKPPLSMNNKPRILFVPLPYFFKVTLTQSICLFDSLTLQ